LEADAAHKQATQVFMNGLRSGNRFPSSTEVDAAEKAYYVALDAAEKVEAADAKEDFGHVL
jgi:hypothetical protein